MYAQSLDICPKFRIGILELRSKNRVWGCCYEKEGKTILEQAVHSQLFEKKNSLEKIYILNWQVGTLCKESELLTGCPNLEYATQGYILYFEEYMTFSFLYL